MIISKRFKLLFVHIPRTGGTSIKRQLYKLDPFLKIQEKRLKLSPHQPMTNELNMQYEDYFKFSIIRNPWHSCLSAYSMWEFNKREVSYKDWLLQQFEERRFFPFPEQMPFIFDKTGKCLVDQIIKFNKENIGIPVDEILNKYTDNTFCLSDTLLQYHAYATIFKNLEDYYTDSGDEAELVYKLCEQDIKHFNWKFPENENE